MIELVLRSALIIAAAVLPAVAAGFAFGPHWGWAIFCLAPMALLAFHLRQLAKLRRWALGSPIADVPESWGVWDEVFAQLYRRRRAQIRQRRRFGRLLARSQQAARALPYGITILDADRHIVWCNDSAEMHFSISLKRDAGQSITNLVRQPVFVNYLDTGDFDTPMEISAARADELVLSVQLVPYVDSHHLLLSRDITQASKLRIMRRDFVANVSHELRTPLTVLVGFLETVRELKLDAGRTRDYLTMMAEQSERMQHIIDDLLTLSSLESAPQPPGGERIDMAALIAQLRSEAESLSGARHRIVIEADPQLDLAGSPGEIASALGNLANNAVRYTPTGGEIRIIWRASDEGAEFSVTDNGIGIDPRHLPRLTERFYRVDRSRSRESGGTGLGLAIAKHALSRHQASLDIQSEPGQGSCFSARFPDARVLRKPAYSSVSG